MNTTDLPDLAEIRIVRKQIGWTQRELARATGLSQSFINKIERNEADPGYRTAKKIFQTLRHAVDKRKTIDKSKTALDVMALNVESVSTNHTVDDARKLMLKNDYSQLPVIDNGLVKGSITDRMLMSLDAGDMKSTKIRGVMERKFPIVDPDTKVETLRYLLYEYAAVLVDRGSRQYGIVTKHDLLRATAAIWMKDESTIIRTLSNPTTCGSDGAYAIEWLLSTDIVAIAGVAIEGLTRQVRLVIGTSPDIGDLSLLSTIMNQHSF